MKIKLFAQQRGTTAQHQWGGLCVQNVADYAQKFALIMDNIVRLQIAMKLNLK